MKQDSLLWEFSRASVSHKSYIFGTIHLYKDDYFEIIKSIEDLIPSVSKVYTETALDVPPHQDHYHLVSDSNLEHMLGVKKFTKAKKIIGKSVGINLDHYKNTLPLIIVQLVSLRMVGADSRPSLDAMIYQLTNEANKEYGGIESIDEQMSIMNGISMDYQLAAFKKMCGNISSFRKNINRMLELYQFQRIHSLYASSRKDMGALRKLLLYDRNEKMADRIDKWHEEKPALFTFGAGHLAGNRGVLALLKRKGNNVKLVNISNISNDNHIHTSHLDSKGII